MTISVEAIYEGGVLRPLWPLNLAEGTKIAVLLERFAIACTDKPRRLTFDGGTICQIVPHTQLQTAIVEPIAAKLEVMREAMNDPLFLADLEEVAEDFKHIDAEGEAQ